MRLLRRITSYACWMFVVSYLLGCASLYTMHGVDEGKERKTVEKKAKKPVRVEKEKVPEPILPRNKIEQVQGLKLSKVKWEEEKPVWQQVNLPRKKVLINTDNMPVIDFIHYTLGTLFNLSYEISEEVKRNRDRIVVHMNAPMLSKDAFKLVSEVLAQHRVSMRLSKNIILLKAEPVQKGGRLQLKGETGRLMVDASLDEIPNTLERITYVATLKYIRVSGVEPLLRSLYKDYIQFSRYNLENAIVLTGMARKVKKVVSFIRSFDVPYLANRLFLLISLTYWIPEDFVKQMESILTAAGLPVSKRKESPGIIMVPLNFINKVIVVAHNNEELRFFMQWKDKIDIPDAMGTEQKIFIYHPKFANATQLIQVAQKVFGSSEGKKIRKVVREKRNIKPPPPLPPELRRKVASRKKEVVLSASTSPIRMSADEERNLVVVSATPSQYKNLLSLFEQLDIMPRQILLEALIAEFTMDNQLDIGTEWALRKQGIMGTGQSLSTMGKLGLGALGLTYQIVEYTGEFRLMFNAFAKEKRIKILSSPKIFVLDNQQASIQVGQEVPVISSEVTAQDITQGEPSILRNIEYRNTGVILNVKPTINSEGMVRLEISQEVSEAQTNDISKDIDSPLIMTRKVNTVVVAMKNQSVLLGGLISDVKSETKNMVPLLGKIPLLGYLFKNKTGRRMRTELFILITPRIVTDSIDIDALSEAFRKKLPWLKEEVKKVKIW